MINQHFGFSSYIQESTWMSSLHYFMEENLLLAAMLYLCFTIIGSSLLALPGITFALVAGTVFGPWLGTSLCCIGTTIGAGLSFLISRYFLKDSLKPIIMKNKYIKKWIFEECENTGILLLMLTRLVPIFPYNLQNFAYGITDISFITYFTCSFFFMLPGIAMYTIGAAGIIGNKDSWLYLLFSFGLFLVVFSIGLMLRKKYLNEDSSFENPTSEVDIFQNHVRKAGCISCGVCRQNCDFLEKYQLDFSDEIKLAPLIDHCFLCGLCTEVCPHGVNGKALVLELRKQKVSNAKGRSNKNLLLQLEKGNYLFKNYRHGKAKTVLFPGCSYPSLYPKTTKMLQQTLSHYGIGTVFDCCGKPIGELGCAEREQKIIQRLNKKLVENGVEEIITMCPNCYDYLKPELTVSVIGIFEALQSLGIGEQITTENPNFFLPCPDRKKKLWLTQIEHYLTASPHILTSAPCCGLGGCAFDKEPDIASNWNCLIKKELSCLPTQQFYVYCASCAGSFTRSQGGHVRHLLNEVIGSNEAPDIHHSFFNRFKFKWN